MSEDKKKEVIESLENFVIRVAKSETTNDKELEAMSSVACALLNYYS